MGKIWAMYFSATGTTKKIVTCIADELAKREGEGKAEHYDFTPPEARKEEKSFSAEDVVVFGVPVYAGRVPNVLLKYLHTVRGNGAKAVPVVLFGNRNYDDALIELSMLLKEDDFFNVAGGAFIGEHAFSKTLGAGRPDAQDMEAAVRFARAIDLNRSEPVHVRGENPIRGYYQPRDRYGTFINILKVKPLTSDACDQCGICAKVCPMGSISAEDASQVTGICIKCGACVKKCPVGAKYYTDEGYLYHKTELEEMYARRAEPEVFV